MVAVIMCEIWGGRKLSIPSKADPSHPIARDIGPDNLAELCRHFGGQCIYLPTFNHARLAHQQSKAARLQALGMTCSEIAEILGVNVKTIGKWLTVEAVNKC